VARRAGARIIEVNPAPSELTHVSDVFLQGPAGQVLPALLDEIRGRKTPRAELFDSLVEPLEGD
jgi:NAD-dependent deacetylase